MAIVRIQDPIRLADSEPEPDVALAKPRVDFYASGKPRPADLLLIIEVADTSLDAEPRSQATAVYAENGVVEYWIVNLAEACKVHRQPRPDGTYQEVRMLRRGQTIDLACCRGVRWRWIRWCDERDQYNSMICSPPWSRVADQVLASGIDHEIQQFQRHLSDQGRAVVGDLDHVTGAVAPLHGQANGAEHLKRDRTGAGSRLPRPNGVQAELGD